VSVEVLVEPVAGREGRGAQRDHCDQREVGRGRHDGCLVGRLTRLLLPMLGERLEAAQFVVQMWMLLHRRRARAITSASVPYAIPAGQSVPFRKSR
jgi:hypothetical protein